MEIIRGRMAKPIKCVVYGPEGIGKSTFASMAPNPVFCDIEDSTTHMDVARFPKATSLAAVTDQINYVLADPTCCDTFVLDTADWLERMCRETVCAKYGKQGIEDFAYGRGYSYVFEEFGRILNKLDELISRGINVIVNAHAAMRKFEQPDENGAYDRWELKLNNSQRCSISNLVKEWADMVLFANYETIVVKSDGKNKAQGGRRVMYTSHHPCWDAKNRFGLPDKLPFDFGQVAGLFVRKSAAPMMSAPAPAPAPAPVPDQLAKEVITELPKMEDFPIIEDDGVYPFDVEIPEGTLKPLADLMRQNAVSDTELSTVVAQRGYYPAGMHVNQYPEDFVRGVLIGAWSAVFDAVKQNRLNNH